MAADRTIVTELATALGTLGDEDLDGILRRRPAQMVNLGDDDWERLRVLRESGRFEDEFLAGFDNGRSFFLAEDALRGRRPRVVEWTGGRRAPGDEVSPADLRIDHVYLVSCKYRSSILHNVSPARLVEGLLSHDPVDDTRDWFERVAPEPYEALYAACSAASGLALPLFAAGLDPAGRRALADTLTAGWPDAAVEPYRALSAAVADATATRWQARIDATDAERVLWRMLRIGAAPYFILGGTSRSPVRLRIDSPWDWRQDFRLARLVVTPQPGGQPRVGWTAHVEHRGSGRTVEVDGHVEIRWSHGRFAQRPEAKLYLDTPVVNVPGYHQL